MSKKNQTERELFPNHSFIEAKTADGPWWRVYRDNDDDTMRMRFRYFADNMQPGNSARWIRADGTIIESKP